VARGFGWQAGATVAAKFVNLCGQVVLALLLVPEDFGLIALALTIHTAIMQIQQRAGGQALLVQRPTKFHVWATPALWISMSMGLLAGLLTLASAVPAAAMYGQPQLRGLIAILALVTPLHAIGMVARAKLQTEFRFPLLARWAFCNRALTTAMTITLAWFGFKAYSFVIPLPVVAAVNSAVLWFFARPRIRRQLQLRRWPYLLATNSKVMLTFAAMQLIFQGDFIALGLFHGGLIVGIYSFAYGLSSNTATVFSNSAAQILLPSLSQIRHDPVRQGHAFIRTIRQLAIIAFPVSLTLAAVSEPLIQMVFPDRWHASVPLVQLLCLAAAVQTVCFPSQALLMSQGRFTAAMCFAFVFGVVFFLGALACSRIGNSHAVACAVVISWLFFGPLQIHLAMRATGLSSWLAYRHLLKAAVIALPPAALAYSVRWVLPGGPLLDPAHLVTGCLIVACLCPPLTWFIDREASRDGLDMLRRIAGRRAAGGEGNE